MPRLLQRAVGAVVEAQVQHGAEGRQCHAELRLHAPAHRRQREAAHRHEAFRFHLREVLRQRPHAQHLRLACRRRRPQDNQLQCRAGIQRRSRASPADRMSRPPRVFRWVIPPKPRQLNSEATCALRHRQVGAIPIRFRANHWQVSRARIQSPNLPQLASLRSMQPPASTAAAGAMALRPTRAAIVRLPHQLESAMPRQTA